MNIKTSIILLFITTSTYAQQGYDIQFKVQGLQDTTALLGYYYGESTYKRDTCVVNDKGEFAFQGKEALPQGVYFIAINKTRVLEFVIGAVQHFKMETSTSDYIKNMKVTGDPDNKIFFENMLFNMERNNEAQPFVAIVKDSTKNEDAKMAARKELDKINEKVMLYHDEIIRKYPNTVTSKIFKVTQRLTAPEPPKKADGSIDSTFQLRWYRQHFFDHFDLSDDANLRLPRPFYSEKINEYLDKLFVPNPDTLAKAIDFMAAKAKPNQDTYKYFIYQMVLKYQNPDIMGLDRVFVHLYDKYFATGEMDYWANETLKKNFREHADRLRKSLVGNIGANLIMQDANFQPRALYDIKNRYTIIYFFDPDCPHCKKETPKLVDFYTKNRARFNLEVFAVSADTSMQAMRDYIKEMKMQWITVNGPRTYVGHYQDLYDSQTTPTIYVLDDKKKIIAKKLPTEKLEEFFVNYEKYHPKVVN
ncbi:MAG TPA: thioredoxin-like domain-containing protein, partial [Cyclobacteriaceae bacterium]|nr:thioredoxin-like domain-containing protein [Cyclobacteriaceae bacterium]